MRQYILDNAEEHNIRTEVRNIKVTELVEIDAAMISNSLIGVWPVRSIAGREYAINAHCLQMVERVCAGKNN
jgi:4-amino-4-deoxychorismate lyase